MIQCDCGKEFDTPTQKAMHKIRKECSAERKAPPKKSSGGMSYQKRARMAKVRKYERDKHGRAKVDNGLPADKQEELERKGAEDGTSAHGIYRWHLPLSVYYHAPQLDVQEPGKAVLAQLRVLDERIQEAIRELDLDGIVIFNVAPGWNVNQCRISRDDYPSVKWGAHRDL